MNANQFLKAIAQLQGWRECAFLLALAERSFPNYALFADAVGLKTGGKMRQMLDLGWDMLQKDVAESAIPQLLAKLETLSPDVEAYDAYGVYPAFDFCQLLEQALLNRLNPAKHRATEASQMATGTVMSFVEVSEGEGLDEDELVRLLDQHPLMKEDKAFQRDLVLALKRQRTPTEQFVERLQADAANEGVSNLGISLSE
ncbi:YjaG family protein [Marinobacter qingdaonensis]|uniref:YjaG family protein n=1 Tax=Marinobacter qingdaonensis TaxID=3108486 RepID=A0ABU5P345_9GAMM|nr:YjaG family protein [Marinobacter sp. ASW11-75]MEA1082407.1 YjaG family protein [Marinobacter sp. ASW11-75]MEE2763632.1 YjaG family protein [Pseudomonadota bacterium]